MKIPSIPCVLLVFCNGIYVFYAALITSIQHTRTTGSRMDRAYYTLTIERSPDWSSSVGVILYVGTGVSVPVALTSEPFTAEVKGNQRVLVSAVPSVNGQAQTGFIYQFTSHAVGKLLT